MQSISEDDAETLEWKFVSVDYEEIQQLSFKNLMCLISDLLQPLLDQIRKRKYSRNNHNSNIRQLKGNDEQIQSVVKLLVVARHS